MDLGALEAAEQRFLDRYPFGFMDPELQAVAKKHRVDRMTELSHQLFGKRNFRDARQIADGMSRIVGRSSLVSVFEKPRFRDFVHALDAAGTAALASALHDFLHTDRERGFDALVGVLQPAKLAKWSLVTLIPNYYWPEREVFVKPTTARGVIAHFGLRGLDYRPLPTWDFYESYRAAILEMKSRVDSSIATSNVAFCGFLMMSMRGAG